MNIGSLFKKVVGSVKAAFGVEERRMETTTYNDIPEQRTQPKGDNVYFWVGTTGLKRTAAKATAGITVNLDTTVHRSVCEAIGEAAVQHFQEALRPLRRTGSVESSFSYQINDNNKTVTIFSNHPAASSIQYGYDTGGSIQSLKEWMKNKSEFKSLDDKEQTRAAYFIIQKISKHDPPGPNSDIRNFAPQGERRYDYLSVVREAVERDTRVLLDNYRDGLGQALGD